MPEGIYVLDQDDGAVVGTYQDIPDSLASPTMVTALDWDDNGSGLLAIGAASPLNYQLHAVRVSASGTFSNHTYWAVKPTTWPHEIALSVAVGHRPDGSPVLAFGMSDGRVRLWDPAVTSPSPLAEFTDGSDAVNAVTFTDRIDGSVGVPDVVAVSSRGNSGRVLRYDGGTTLRQLPVAPGSGGTKTDVGGVRAWFPGYKTGSVQFVNQSTSDDFELDFATSDSAPQGCWFTQDFADRAALPTTEVTVGHGQSSAVYALAARTAGEDGACAATDVTGQWAAYVTVTPKGRPADRTVAKLALSRTGELTMTSVGATKLVATKNTNPADVHPLGGWTITIQSPDQPTPPSKLTITGTQLDPAGTTKPVYRIDVPATQWGLPVSTPPRAQTLVPPLEARGTTATGGDVSLGLLVPQGQPVRATSGSVTLSKVSFYWQNPKVGQQITDIYVKAGVDAASTSSAKVNLASLTPPAAGTTIGQVIACPATGTNQCDAKADPVANGLDQASLRIQLFDTDNNELSSDDAAYGQVYYRDQDGDLLTGLIPADGTSYLRVSPYAAYGNWADEVSKFKVFGRPQLVWADLSRHPRRYRVWVRSRRNMVGRPNGAQDVYGWIRRTVAIPAAHASAAAKLRTFLVPETGDQSTRTAIGNRTRLPWLPDGSARSRCWRWG